MKNWLRRNESPAGGAAQDPQRPVLQQGLYLELDLQGMVRHCGGSLAELLVPHRGDLQHLLAEPVSWCAADLPFLEGDVLELALRRKDGDNLYLRGWHSRLNDGWAIRLLDVSDQVTQRQSHELRLRILAFAAGMAMRLRGARLGDLESLSAEYLEGLVLRLSLPAVGLLLPRAGAGGWRIYSRFVVPGPTQVFPDELLLGQLLSRQVGSLPRKAELPNLAATTSHAAQLPLWLVPYEEREGVTAWLVCLCDESSRRMEALTVDDWLQLTSALATPVLQHLRDASRREENARNGLLQRMLGGGWWEYRPHEDDWQLAPALQDALGLADQPAAAWLTLLHPGDQEAFRLHLLESASHAQGFTQVLRLRQGAAWRWFRVTVEVYGRAERLRLVGFAVDIEDLQGVAGGGDQALAPLTTLADQVPGILYTQRYETGALRPTFYSTGLGRLLGWSSEELREHGVLSLVHADDRERYLERSRRLLVEGRVTGQYRLRDRWGQYRWLLDEACLRRDDLGQPQEVFGVCLESDGAQRELEPLRQSEAYYRALIEQAPALIGRCGPDLALHYANPAVRALLQRVAAGGHLDLQHLLGEAQTSACLQRLQALQPSCPLLVSELWLPGPEGDMQSWLWGEQGLFAADGTLQEVQVLALEQSALQALRAQQLTQTLKDLSADLAAELGEPLARLQAWLAAWQLEPALAGAPAPSILADNLQVLARTVARIGGFLPPDASQAGSAATCLLAPVIDQAIAAVAQTLVQQSVALEVDLQAIGAVSCDASRLEPVLVRLLEHLRDDLLERQALRHEPRMGIRLRSGSTAEGTFVVLENNAGAHDPAYHAALFEPFAVQSPAADGLGLSLEQDSLRRLGGTLGSDEGEAGLRLTLWLPGV